MKKSFAISSVAHLALLSIIMVTSNATIRLSSNSVITVNLVAPKPQPRVTAPAKVEEKAQPKKAPDSKMKYRSTKPKAKSKQKTSKAKKSTRSRKEKSQHKPATTSTKGTAGVRVDEDFKFGYYLELIKERISNAWSPPPVGGKTVATVYFRITRNGDVSDLKLEQSSGSEMFDKSALRAVSEVAPLPPLPAGFKGKWLGVHFEFEHRSS